MIPVAMLLKILNFINSKLKYIGCRGVKRRRGQDGKIYVYTLRDFERRECIFVHIPKTGGMSVNQALFGHCGGGHKTVREYRDLFGDKFYEYYKFTFTRNPYVRLVSAYEYLRRGGHPAWPGNQEFGEEVLGAYENFQDFVLRGLRPYRADWSHPHFYPQTHFIELEGRIAVDFIGHVETFERDFAVVCDRLDEEVRLPESNETPGDRKPLKAYYSKDSVIRRVQEIYDSDFERLRYSTDLGKAKAPPPPG